MAGLTKEQRAQRAAEKAAKEAAEKAEAEQVGADPHISVEGAVAISAANMAAAIDAEVVESVKAANAAMPLARGGNGKLSAATEEPDLTGLVIMVKDGETLPVHPTCVRAHINAGWKAVE